MKLAEGQVKDLGKVKTTRKRSMYLLLCFLFILSLLSGGLVAYNTYSSTYQRYFALAQTGVQDLHTAVSLLQTLPRQGLDAHLVEQANQNFAIARGNFTQVESGLESLPSLTTSMPVYGARLSAALHVLPLAIAATQAGQDACAILQLLLSRFHNPLDKQNQGLTVADMHFIDGTFLDLKTIFSRVSIEVQHLQPSDLRLDPRLEKVITSFRDNFPVLQNWMNQFDRILPILPALLGVGQPANYLIEILDSTELRPGGGFIGNYGVVTLSGGRLLDAHISDVYLLDNAFYNAGHSIPYPATYRWFFNSPSAGWSLRDSNLDADFPTAARFGEQNYAQEGGKVSFQGAIAITPTFIRHVLEITGPIVVPEYHTTANSQNLVDLIHYYQLGPGRVGNDTPSPDGHSSVRKRFTELLAEDLLARLRQTSSSSIPAFLKLIMNSLYSKDIQVYFNSQTAESLLHTYHLDSTIQSTRGDSLFVVDANISPSKANAFIMNTLDDQVVIDQQGNATHRTTLTYAWNTNGNVYGSPLYRDYVRVYTPPDSTLLTQSGWEARGVNSAFHQSVWAGLFTLTYGQTRTITLVWTSHKAAQKGINGWHYAYLIQRQAGAQWTLHLQVTMPSCAAVTKKQGDFQTHDHALTIPGQSLDEDFNAEIDYNCN